MQRSQKVVLITGASGGLGASVVRAFLASGAKIVGVSRSIKQSEFDHPSFVAMPADVSSAEKAHALASDVVSRHGGIDVLAHLVGSFAGGKSVDETDDATFDRMFDLNFSSALQMFRAVVPVMRSQKSGAILAIGSRFAVEPRPSVSAYSASKAALVALVRTVALENKAAGITANVVLPETMDTPVNRAAMPAADFSKWVQPDAVASVLVSLAANPSVTGAVIPVYGAAL